MISTQEVSLPCPRGCGGVVEYTQTYLSGKLIGVVPACDACADERDRDEDQERQEEIRRRREAESKRRRAGILRSLEECGASPWEHGRASFETFDPSESGTSPLEAAKRFVSDVLSADEYESVRGLYLAGQTGCGKSHLATAIARALLLDPRVDPGTVVFDPADVLISRIRSLYGGRGDVDAFLRRREKARVWILDDLGREPPHPDVVGHLTMLISQRSCRGTVITGNLMPDQYESRSPELARIGSRLGDAYFEVIEVRGRDRRFDRPAPRAVS